MNYVVPLDDVIYASRSIAPWCHAWVNNNNSIIKYANNYDNNSIT